jgi:hypothetical protein
MARTTVDFDFFKHWMMVVHTSAPPLSKEWDEYIAAARDNAARLVGMIVSSEGGAPDAHQRKQGEALVPLQPNLKIAVVTRSPGVRMVIIILHWINVKVKAFAPGEVAAAAEFLGVPEADRPALAEAWAALKARLAAAASAASTAPVPGVSA